MDPLGDHRAACPRSGLLRSRAGPFERALATICREAGTRVATHTRLADLNVSVDRVNNRRLEVVATGLPPWGGCSSTALAAHLASKAPSKEPPSMRPDPQRALLSGALPEQSLPSRRLQHRTLERGINRIPPAPGSVPRSHNPGALLRRWAAILTHAALSLSAFSLTGTHPLRPRGGATPSTRRSRTLCLSPHAVTLRLQSPPALGSTTPSTPGDWSVQTCSIHSETSPEARDTHKKKSQRAACPASRGTCFQSALPQATTLAMRRGIVSG